MGQQRRMPGMETHPVQEQLPGHAWHLGDFRRSDAFTAGATSYKKSAGMPQGPGIDHYAGIRADPDVYDAVGRHVAAQQGPGSGLDEKLGASYGVLHQHIDRQFAHLTTPKERGGMGITVETTDSDPYRDPMHMRDEVHRTGVLKVLATGATGGTQQMPSEVNDKFRAVHDAFGHLATGRGFGRHGEEAAMQHHATMFPAEAHPAMASELRAQNAHLIRMGDFPANKAYGLPDWASKPQAEFPEAKRSVLSRQMKLPGT